MALVLGTSPQGRGFESHRCQLILLSWNSQTLVWDFFLIFFSQIKPLYFRIFDITLEHTDRFKFSIIWWWISWCGVSFPSTESMPSEALRRLSQCRVRFYIDWVKAEWNSMSTESGWNDGVFINAIIYSGREKLRAHEKFRPVFKPFPSENQ
jgi:hypothetical protein